MVLTTLSKLQPALPCRRVERPSADKAAGGRAKEGSVLRKITSMSFVHDVKKSVRTGQCFTPPLPPPQCH